MIWIIQLKDVEGNWFNAWPHSFYEKKILAIPAAKELCKEAMVDGWRVVKYKEAA